MAGSDYANTRFSDLDEITTGFGSRAYVAGVLTNTPEHLIRWGRVAAGSRSAHRMPDVGVSRADARDIAAYLYTRP